MVRGFVWEKVAEWQALQEEVDTVQEADTVQ